MLLLLLVVVVVVVEAKENAAVLIVDIVENELAAAIKMVIIDHRQRAFFVHLKAVRFIFAFNSLGVEIMKVLSEINTWCYDV